MSQERKRALLGILGLLGIVLLVVGVIKGVAGCRNRMTAKSEPVEAAEPLKAAS